MHMRGPPPAPGQALRRCSWPGWPAGPAGRPCGTGTQPAAWLRAGAVGVSLAGAGRVTGRLRIPACRQRGRRSRGCYARGWGRGEGAARRGATSTTRVPGLCEPARTAGSQCAVTEGRGGGRHCCNQNEHRTPPKLRHASGTRRQAPARSIPAHPFLSPHTILPPLASYSGFLYTTSVCPSSLACGQGEEPRGCERLRLRGRGRAPGPAAAGWLPAGGGGLRPGLEPPGQHPPRIWLR